MCDQVAPSGECLQGKGPPNRMLAKPWRRLFLAAYTFWAKPGCCCCPAWQSVYCVIAALRGRQQCCMQWLKCNGTQGNAVPPPQIVIMPGKGTRPLSGAQT